MAAVVLHSSLLHHPVGLVAQKLSTSPSHAPPRGLLLRNPKPNLTWDALQIDLKSRGRFSCLFSGNSKQDQAKKALESALGGKKSEFEKWNKEIEKRKESGGGGTGGRGGWFGGGGWSNWFSDEHFRDEAKEAILTLAGIVLLYLLIAKGGVMFAVISNSLLYILRGARNGLSSVSSLVSGNRVPVTESVSSEAQLSQSSAKDNVVKKWGAD